MSYFSDIAGVNGISDPSTSRNAAIELGRNGLRRHWTHVAQAMPVFHGFDLTPPV